MVRGHTQRHASLDVRPPGGGSFRVSLRDTSHLTVGRSDTCDLVLPDTGLSRHHLTLVETAGEWWVQDHGSRAGTRLGHKEVALGRLHAGDELRLGAYSAVFRMPLEARSGGDSIGGGASASLGSFGDLRTASPSMVRVFETLRLAVDQPGTPVMLWGEFGVGKERLARELHRQSERAGGPFVSLHCQVQMTQPHARFLFGTSYLHNALTKEEGVVHAAIGGTLFVDDINRLQRPAQSLLAESLPWVPIAWRKSAEVQSLPDVTVVATSSGGQRPDLTVMDALKYSVTLMPIRVPTLRERLDDIPGLAQQLLGERHPEASLTEGAVDKLLKHHWPGNVRELRNVLTRAVLTGGPRVTPESISFRGLGGESPTPPSPRPRLRSPNRGPHTE